jgi:hypothetical protein
MWARKQIQSSSRSRVNNLNPDPASKNGCQPIFVVPPNSKILLDPDPHGSASAFIWLSWMRIYEIRH